MPRDDSRCIAAAQLGLISRRQAHRAGLSDRQIRTRVARGIWQTVHPSVFLVGAESPRQDQLLLAATLATGGILSHGSAGWLSELVDRRPAKVHVLTHRSAGHRVDGIVVHRVDDLRASDCGRERGIPMTTPTRTLLDLASVLDEADLRAAVHRAVGRRLTHPDRLIGRFLSMRTRGRPGAAAMRRVLTDLDHDLRLLDSELELRLVELIRSAGLPPPTLQHEIVVHGRTFRADLAYPERRLLIEGDGFGVHGERDAFESDRERQNLLVLDGWRVLRFTWRQIVREPAWVVAQIRTALGPDARSRGRR